MLSTDTFPLITVVTPTFNAASCIERCIQSVMEQTYENVEQLIIDGQSTDETVSIVQRFQAVYLQKIRYVSEPDKGIYDAMNKGIQKAKGKWMLFLGGDDFMYNNTVLEKAISTLKNTNKQIIYGDAWIEKMDKLYDGIFDTEKLLKHNFCHQAIFYSSQVFIEMGLFNPAYKIEADYDFNLRCWLSGKILFQYIPIAVAFHSTGGVSTEQRDTAFVRDYPTLVMKYTLQGSYSSAKRIDILSKIYIKLLLRYSVKDVLKYTFDNNFIYKFLAFAWMPFAFLYKKLHSPL